MRAASAMTFGIAAEKLGGDGVLVFVEMKIAFCLLIFLAENAVGRGELGHDEAASAEVADKAAEDRIGNACHGREDGGGGDGDGTDLEAGRDRFQGRGLVGDSPRAVCLEVSQVLRMRQKLSPQRSQGNTEEPATLIHSMRRCKESPRFGRGLDFSLNPR